MRVLVIGGGGREHALVWRLAQSPRVKKIYCVPGNAGISELAECVPLAANDFGKLLSFAQEKSIDWTVVGPEVPLVGGIVDRFEQKGLKIFGPSRQAAQIEGSKVFAKQFMQRHGIPTADFQVFDSETKALRYIGEKKSPFVVKASGLAAGKGVIVPQDWEGSASAVTSLAKSFPEAAKQIVLEECLEGEEASFMAFTDGTNVVPMVSSQDHKRIGDGDTGPNTGGMGAYSPAPVITQEIQDQVMREVMIPAIRGFQAEGTLYRGVLYAGLMITRKGPRVLEFNCRFGDPEAQVLLSRLETDLVNIIEATLSGRLAEIPIRWSSNKSVCVVMASRGYPDGAETDREITGIAEAEQEDHVKVFHAATIRKEGRLLTNGGRVLGVTALDESMEAAIQKAYRAVGRIRFEGMQYRKDIGARALNRKEEEKR